jgi:hypothetical protein
VSGEQRVHTERTRRHQLLLHELVLEGLHAAWVLPRIGRRLGVSGCFVCEGVVFSKCRTELQKEVFTKKYSFFAVLVAWRHKEDKTMTGGSGERGKNAAGPNNNNRTDTPRKKKKK